MNKYRIGNTYNISWQINADGVQLSDLDLMLRRNEPVKSVDNIPFTIDGDVLKFVHQGIDQKLCGKYTYTLFVNYGKENQAAVDSCAGYVLVPSSCLVSGGDSDIQVVEEIHLSSQTMLIGVEGKSAYQVAVENGFVGTEQEWLASLKPTVTIRVDDTTGQIIYESN